MKSEIRNSKIENRQAEREGIDPIASGLATSHSSLATALKFHDKKHGIKIYQGDCLDILAAIPEGCIDLIFADPPYFLSNDGIPYPAGVI